MAKMLTNSNKDNFAQVVAEIKSDIQTTQVRTIQQVNSNLIMLYFRIGKILSENSKYGNRFIENVAMELRIDFPDLKGFSSRNLWNMQRFYLEYKDSFQILQQPVAELQRDNVNRQPLFLQLTWGQNLLLLNKIKDKKVRTIYAEAAIKNGWSRSILDLQIKSEYHKRIGKSANNFKATLPAADSDLVNNTFKDPYIFDFIQLKQGYKEAELESAMIEKIKRVLLELGKGFSFVGSQYKISVEGKDYYLDLLFYHLELRCYIVVELKATEFKPEYTGQLGFYVTAINKLLKKDGDNPTIGLLLCKDKNGLTANWSLEGSNLPLGVSSFEILDKLPTEEELNLHID